MKIKAQKSPPPCLMRSYLSNARNGFSIWSKKSFVSRMNSDLLSILSKDIIDQNSANHNEPKLWNLLPTKQFLARKQRFLLDFLQVIQWKNRFKVSSKSYWMKLRVFFINSKSFIHFQVLFESRAFWIQSPKHSNF